VSQGNILRLRDGDELVCWVQTDLGLETPYTLCAPVVPHTAWGSPVPRLHIPILVNETPCYILMSQMVAIPTAQLGAPVADASAWRDEMIAAVDLLVSGF